jgi:multicomponent Na+:H+ antiporter subunit E
MKNWVVSMILLFGLWLLLSADLAVPVLIAGFIVVFLIVLLFSVRNPVFRDIKLGPKALSYIIIYPFVFLKALVMANFDVARRVLSPSLPIRPAIVEVRTRLHSPIGRLMLANSITLTPGTLTVEIQGDSLFIHWIDASATDINGATESIVRGFEKYLEVIYG